MSFWVATWLKLMASRIKFLLFLKGNLAAPAMFENDLRGLNTIMFDKELVNEQIYASFMFMDYLIKT